MKLNVRLPDMGEQFVGTKMREFVRRVEEWFNRVDIDLTLPAYAVTANATLTGEDDIVLVDTSGGDVTITLPEISESMVKNKQEFELVKTSAANELLINPTGTDTIVGDTSVLVSIQWTALRFRATTGNWVII